MEPAVTSLQPTADSTQTGPAECAERLNPPPPAKSRWQGVLDCKPISATPSQSSFPLSYSILLTFLYL